MTTAAPLDIKVVYDSRARRGRSRPRASATRKQRSLAWGLVGTLNLAMAAGLCYATWWPVDAFLRETMIMKMPVQVDPEAVAAMLFGGAAKKAPSTSAQPSGDAAPEPRFTGETAQTVIIATGYGWLTVATIASCALAMAGGASWGRGRDAVLRYIAGMLAIVVVGILAWRAYVVWSARGFTYSTGDLQAGMVGLFVLVMLLGLTLGRVSRGLTRVAGIALIFTAVGGVVSLYLGSQANAVDLSAVVSVPLAIAVLATTAVWGLLLMPVAARIGR